MYSIPISFKPATTRRASGLICKATQVPEKYDIQPSGDRVLVKTAGADQQTSFGIVLPKVAQKKKTEGEIVAVAEVKQVKVGDKVAYSTYAGTELAQGEEEFLMAKEVDLIGVMTSDRIADMQPLFDRVLIEMEKGQESTEAGVLLTSSDIEQPTIGKVVAVGPGTEDSEGTQQPLNVQVGTNVLYSRYSGTEFQEESGDKQKYIVVRESDILGTVE